MAKYRINGGDYDVSDTLQGDDLTTTLTQLADYTASQNKQKFLNFLGKSEGADYDVIVGGRQKITDYTTHPNVVGLRTADGPSTAAGKYQITGTTYRDMAPGAGVTDFSPASQDKIALALIDRKGAMDDVTSGNFNGAIAKLGGTWASLPSSKYAQPKRSQAWVDQELSQPATSAAPQAAPAATYKPFGTVVPKVDQATLNTNTDWLKASAQVYSWKERKQWSGDEAGLAEYGKSVMGYFNNNVVAMTADAAGLAQHGTQDDKNAFLYMMDQYDETNTSWAGAGRAAMGMVTDPVNLIGLGTLGTATVGKIAASIAAKEVIRKTLFTSLGRTGIQAGILGGIQAGVTDTIKQGVSVTGGRQDSVDLGRVAANVGIGLAAGATLGTAADALLTVAAPVVKNTVGKIAEILGKGKAKPVPLVPKGPPVAAAVVPPTGVPIEAPPVSVVASPVPIRGFHGTKATEAEVANATGLTKSEDLGPHFTVDPDTAKVFAEHGGTPGRLLRADLSITNPLELPDLMGWHAHSIADAIDNAGLTASKGNGHALGELGAAALHAEDAASKAFWADFPAELQVPFGTPKSKWSPAYKEAVERLPDIQHNAAKEVVRDWMNSKGYDGIKYTNKFEGKQVDTYIATDMSKVHDPAGPPPLRTEAPKVPPDPTATLPISSTFTDEELKALGTRGQKGRLWADDLPLALPLDERTARALVIPDSEAGLRATVRNMAKLTADAQTVAAQIRILGDSDLRQTMEVLRNITSLQDAPVVFRAVQVLHDEMRVELAGTMRAIQKATPDELAGLIAKQQRVEDRLVHVQLADDAMGSAGGSLNRQRLEGLVGLQGSTPDSLMLEKGINRKEAEQLWMDTVDASQGSSKAKQVAGEYDLRIQTALDANDLGEVAALSIQKRAELNGIAEEAAPGGSTWASKLHTGFSGLRELMISNLFTVKTVMVNLVPAALKTGVLPLVKYLVTNPLEKAAMAELGAHYSAMGGTIKAALTASHTAFKYEQSILTKDSGRLLEGEMVMTGRVGGGLRFFPRVLNASDEFLSQINYAGYVAGKAANKAALEGAEQGLKGKALKDFVGDAITAAKGRMYESADESTVQPIVNKGVNLGLSGEDLLNYVRAEGAKNPEALRHGADKDGLDFSRDVLYKRAFSGGNPGDSWYKNEASGGAVAIEGFLRKAPEFSLLIGQLFFRTPIRVFEEGIRMTPGVQILAPGFMKDLAGGNGAMRQVRAQGEALVGLAVTGAALSLYASGAITGSGVYNSFKQDKTRKDGPGPEPYTIQFKDGSTWSFKNIDPISTPLKILINAFEGMDELKIKEAQEQYENKPAYKLLMARVSVATMAIAAALTDANLVAGLKGSMDFAKELADPEGDEAAIVKKVGTELGMLVPNTLHKIAQMNDPRLRDPATFFQSIESRLGHNLVGTDEVKSPFAYDPLGQVREAADTGSMWNIFSTATREERIRGNTVEHQKVMLEFDRLAQETGAIFSAPSPKNPMTGDLDLRTMMTSDAEETMFDRWQRNYRDLNPDQILLPIAQSSAPDGTFKMKGMKVEMLQSEMKNLQQIAFEQLLTDERLRERLILTQTQKARASAGLMDFGNVNK